MPPPDEQSLRRCARPGCNVFVRGGQLACKDHWYALKPRTRDQLVHAWEQRKAHPDVPEMVDAHRALLLQCLIEWGVPVNLRARAAAARHID